MRPHLIIDAEPCPDCKGYGWFYADGGPDDRRVDCWECGGSGEIDPEPVDVPAEIVRARRTRELNERNRKLMERAA